ncbi:hypothetical protein ACS0TY_023313 [Phlomoides rotata]
MVFHFTNAIAKIAQIVLLLQMLFLVNFPKSVQIFHSLRIPVLHLQIQDSILTKSQKLWRRASPINRKCGPDPKRMRYQEDPFSLGALLGGKMGKITETPFL